MPFRPCVLMEAKIKEVTYVLRPRTFHLRRYFDPSFRVVCFLILFRSFIYVVFWKNEALLILSQSSHEVCPYEHLRDFLQDLLGEQFMGKSVWHLMLLLRTLPSNGVTWIAHGQNVHSLLLATANILWMRNNFVCPWSFCLQSYE